MKRLSQIFLSLSPLLSLLLLATPATQAQDIDNFPPDLVRWRADPGTPVFQGTAQDTWDRKIRERGWIFVDNGVYHLFYTGYNEYRSPLRMLGHATSPDGIHWTRDPKNPLVSTGWVEDMSLVKQGETYHMFAEGLRDIAHRLTSTDLTHWTEHGQLQIKKTDGTPISPGPRGTPFVLLEGDTWNLLYERADQGVWLARSIDDPQTFTNVSDEPVLRMGPEPYDQHAVAINQVFKHDGFYYALYHANAHRPWQDWSTCIARSTDLVHWQKYPGNPLIQNNRSSAILVQDPTKKAKPHLFTMHPEVVRFSNP